MSGLADRSAMLRRCLHVVWSVPLTDPSVAQVRSYTAFAVVYTLKRSFLVSKLTFSFRLTVTLWKPFFYKSTLRYLCYFRVLCGVFPHHVTLNQFFTSSMYTAYHREGYRACLDAELERFFSETETGDEK